MNKIIVQYQPFVMDQKVMVLDDNNKPISNYNIHLDQIPDLVATLSKKEVDEIALLGSKTYIAQQKNEITEKVNNVDIKIIYV